MFQRGGGKKDPMRPSFYLFILLLLGPALLSPTRRLLRSPAPSTQTLDPVSQHSFSLLSKSRTQNFTSVHFMW